MTRVIVIVLNFNGKHFLRACLTSLREQTYRSFAVVLVDNNSTDGSIELVRAEYPEVLVLALPENLGFCGGNNRGIAATASEFVALLNNDTVVSPQWLEELVGALDRAPHAGMATSKMVFADTPHLVDTAGDEFFWCGIGRKRGHMAQDGPEYSEERPVFGACGGAALYRRTMLEDVGLLDERFFMYDDDIDLSFRAQLRGYQCVFVPQALVYHKVSGTAGAGSDRAIYWSKRNSTWVVLKNVPLGLLVKLSWLIVPYALFSDCRWILSGRARPVVHGRLDALRALPAVLQERAEIQRRRRVSNKELLALLTPGVPQLPSFRPFSVARPTDAKVT